jgi:hypothetical protein
MRGDCVEGRGVRELIGRMGLIGYDKQGDQKKEHWTVQLVKELSGWLSSNDVVLKGD